jgi:four helix bundle protein
VAEQIRTFRDLVAWQKAFGLGKRVYRATETFPERERFGLTVQLRRGAVSVASNIAEGYGRGSTVDYVRFLKVARGCLYELDTQLMFAMEFQYLVTEQYEGAKLDLDECERVLAGLIRSLERRSGA